MNIFGEKKIQTPFMDEFKTISKIMLKTEVIKNMDSLLQNLKKLNDLLFDADMEILNQNLLIAQDFAKLSLSLFYE